ncbi:MAG: ABC transporter permease, partial [Phycisphaerales bacterium]|nr:ABC transporter permease [Phycisphaerales bacterium]
MPADGFRHPRGLPRATHHSLNGMAAAGNVGSIMNDLKFALRQLFKNPGFTAVAVLTLALGIGANTVVFSVAKAVLFRPLGLDAPDRLMWIRLLNTRTGNFEDRLSWREIEDIRESAQSFESVATFGTPGTIWEQDDRAEEVPALRVTPNLADVLRIHPVLGRTFHPSDANKTAEPVVLISHELWQSRFEGRSDVIGRTLRLDRKSRTI